MPSYVLFWINAEPFEVRYSKRSFSSPEPFSSRRWIRAGSFFHGVSSEKSNLRASDLSVPPTQVPPASPHAAIAPAAMLFEGSGTTFAGSTSSREPSPSQAGHAPYGELNEKLRGSRVSTLKPQPGHDAPWLNSSSSASRRAGS